MKTARMYLQLLTILTLQTAALQAEPSNAETGMIQVFVGDVDGNPMAKSNVYISDRYNRVEFLQTDEKGAVRIDLRSGNYHISSAINTPREGWIDRFASRTASVRVVTQDTVFVNLILHPVEDPIATLSVPTLQKIGVADEVAKYLN